MPIYKLKVEGGIGPSAEPITVELADAREAQIEAVQFLGEQLKTRPVDFWEHQEASVTVSDERGLDLFKLELSAFVAPALRKE